MENAADALKMAAAVLIFVLALSICINAFGEVRKTSQIVLDYKDREYETEYIEGDSTERIVGIESIIPTIYKSYKENYKVVFDGYDTDTKYLFKKSDSSGNNIPIGYIDLENESLGSETDKREFIEAILYGAKTEIRTKFLARGITLNTPGTALYDDIKDKQLVEKLGVYYQEELQQDDNNTGYTPDANKTKKRVITYYLQ